MKSTSGRNGTGQFTPGNPGGPGRPRRETERAYLSIISEACPPETWRQIVERAVDRAKYGDAKAREWLASYLVGKPARNATTLHALAVEAEAGSDPVALEAKARRGQDQMSDLLAGVSGLG
ncbi:MAG TPA: hypothetical protein VKV26_25830 [Dehalococcoidia bacterium]|nr:hypothetical protein [Dehalococcoidia bacterium]